MHFHERLSELDGKAEVLRVLSNKALTAPKTPIQFTASEQGKILEKEADISALEERLREKYGGDFGSVGWHGRTSQQRILWQDEEFLKLLRDPLTVKLILLRRQEDRERPLNIGSMTSPNTLSSMLLYGLRSNLPSYLASAAPNWFKLPDVPNVRWKQLRGMSAVCESRARDNPRRVDEEALSLMREAAASVESALSEIHGEQDIKPSTLARKVGHASTQQLYNAMVTLLDVQKAAVLVHGEAGASTGLVPMSCQCLEVMSNYDQLVDANDGSHAAALGYGLVSHALDAKHLPAAIIYGLEGKHDMHGQPVGKDDESMKALRQLLDGAQSGAIGPEASALVRNRLQQVLRLIVENRRALGLEETRIASALAE